MFPSFAISTRVFVNVSAPDVLASELMRLQGRRVLLVTDPGVEKAGLLPRITDSLPTACTLIGTFEDITQDPTVAVMDQASGLCCSEAADVILAVGGGACLDTAKAAAIVASNGGSIRDFVGEDKFRNLPLPVVAVPTTAGTGSEVTWHISVNDAERRLKVTVRSPLAVPAVAILDPEMVATVPAQVAAATGMDALTHCVESYLGNNGAWDLTDAIASHAIGMIGRSMVQYWRNPHDRYHAAQMQMAACFGGLALSHSRTGIVHQMARPLGAMFHIPHGLANAVLLPWCLDFTHKCQPERFARVARALGEQVDGLTAEAAAAQVATAVRRMNRAMQVPASLAALGVTADAIEQMAEDALQGKSTVTNPCVATKADVMAIYTRALRGDADV